MNFPNFKMFTNLIPQRLRARGAKDAAFGGSQLVRAGMTLGPWDALLHTFVPQLVNPYFYEALRRAMPLIDGGINMMVLLDGIVRIEGKDQALVNEITAAMAEIRVDDCETGLQSFYEITGTELYEQGFAMAERVFDARGRALVALRTADSKGMLARRNEDGTIEWYYRPPAYELAVRRNGTDYTEVVLRNNIVNVTPGYINQLNYMALNPLTLLYSSYRPEPNGPYGVSIMRSIEFVSQILMRIQNATGHVWDRFGDPSFHLTYATKNRNLKGPDLDKRRDQLAGDLANVLAAKRSGNSADLVNAIGADDTITLNVIGANGATVNLDIPAKHMSEQILAKIPVPGWMLGLSDGSNNRMGDQQSEMVLMSSKVRFERRLPMLNGIVQSWLRGQGIAWKPGDWQIVQELPNLRDVMKQAQARFLNAQADLMTQGRLNETPPTPVGVTASQGGDPNAAKSIQTRLKKNGDVVTTVKFGNHSEHYLGKVRAHPLAHACAHHKSAGDDGGEPWAESDPTLPNIESNAVDGLLALWNKLEAETAVDLGIVATDAAGSAIWTFDASTMLAKLQANQDRFIAAAGAEDGPLVAQAFDAFVRGLRNAASEFDAEVALDRYRTTIQQEITDRQLALVQDAAVRTYHDGILKQLADGAFDGQNPNAVADQLAAAFDLGDYDWTRLARTEIANAQMAGKLREYADLGVTKVNWVTAPGACAICEELAAGGPYTADNAPSIDEDSHPNCRCTILAVDPAADNSSTDSGDGE